MPMILMAKEGDDYDDYDYDDNYVPSRNSELGHELPTSSTPGGNGQ